MDATTSSVYNTGNNRNNGFFKNIATDIGRAGLATGLKIPGLLFKQLSNQVNDLGVYLIGIPTQGFAENENKMFQSIRELVLKLDDFDNRLGNDQQLVQLREKITSRFIEIASGSIDDIVESPKLQTSLNNLLDKLKSSGVNTAKVFITGAKDVVLEVPGLGAVVAIVDTGTKAVIAGSSVVSSLIAMVETGAIIAKTTNESIQKIIAVLNDFSLPNPNNIQSPTLPTIGQMRETNQQMNTINQTQDQTQIPPPIMSSEEKEKEKEKEKESDNINSLPSIDEMRRRNNGLSGGAKHLKSLARQKNTIETRITRSIRRFMSNKSTKKKHHKYTNKRRTKR